MNTDWFFDALDFLFHPLVVAFGLLVLCAGGLFYFHHIEENVEMPKAYAAWVKLTGNEKHLTFDEWRALVRANDNQTTDTTFIPIYTNYR